MSDRLARLGTALIQPATSDGQPLEADAMLVVDETNVRYLSGFTGDSSWLLVQPDGGAMILSDRRYETQIAEECPTLAAAIRPPDQTLVQLLDEILPTASLKRIAFEASHVSVATLKSWTTAFPAIQWIPTLDIVETLRAIKDAGEVESIRRSIRVAERSFLSVMPQLTPRITEAEVAHELEATMRRLGATGVSFPPIVGAQPSGALPHYRPRNVPLADCHTLLVDWGAMVDGYCSDLTRTMHQRDVGGPQMDRFRRAYQVVLEAQEAAIAAIADGVDAAQVDAAARTIVQAAGLGEAFKHGLGHGFGLQIHERPRLGPTAQQTLRTGMVVTVEPGVYFEGEFGIRIEDDVLVTAQGCERLSSLPKGLDDCPLVM